MRTKLIDKIDGHLWTTRRALFLLGGSVALLLALVGAIMPVMPATPFLLLSAYCYARSSRRCHTWLTTNRFFGRYIARMAEGRRLSLPAKGVLIAASWCTATLSAVFFAPNLAVRIAGLSMAAAMSAYILLQGRRQVQCVPEEVRPPRPRQR